MRFPGTDDEFCSEKNKQISIMFTVVKKCDLWGCQITRNDVNTQAIEKYWKKRGTLGNILVWTLLLVGSHVWQILSR